MATAKRYFSKIAGSQFIQPDGHVMLFAHGFFDFKPEEYQGVFILTGVGQNDPRNGKDRADVYQAELEMVLKQKGGNPLIYDQSQVQQLDKLPTPIPPIAQNAKSAEEIAKQDSSLAGTRHKESGDQNTGTISVGGSDPNSSTIDHNLRNKVADFAKGDSKAEQLRAAAVARSATSVSSK